MTTIAKPSKAVAALIKTIDGKVATLATLKAQLATVNVANRGNAKLAVVTAPKVVGNLQKAGATVAESLTSAITSLNTEIAADKATLKQTQTSEKAAAAQKLKDAAAAQKVKDAAAKAKAAPAPKVAKAPKAAATVAAAPVAKAPKAKAAAPAAKAPKAAAVKAAPVAKAPKAKAAPVAAAKAPKAAAPKAKAPKAPKA